MIEGSKLYIFIVAALALLLVPGPAVLYITARSASQGRMAGLVSVLAIETANFTQAVAAAFGLAAILYSSALAFNVVKYLGAAYLIYLGPSKKYFAQEIAMWSLRSGVTACGGCTGRDLWSTS